MNILKKIQTPLEPRSIDVEHGGEVYHLAGRPDLTVYSRILMLTREQKLKKAEHWEKIIGEPISEEAVTPVMLVASCLAHEDDPARRYDEHQIARLSLTHGGLVMALFGASMQLVGLGADEELSPAEQVAAGN